MNKRLKLNWWFEVKESYIWLRLPFVMYAMYHRAGRIKGHLSVTVLGKNYWLITPLA